MMGKRFCLAMGLVCMVCLMSGAAWAVPEVINYQGKLTNTSDCVLTGTYKIRFLLYDTESGGATLWDEVQNVSVVNGIFNVHLGAVASFPIGLFESDSLYLETVILNPDTGLWETLSPRQHMTSTAYAIKADHAATAQDADTVDGKHASELIVPETDPTVPANLKDGVSWSEVANIPSDIADGDQVGITTEQDPKIGSTTANSIPKWDGATGTLIDSSSIVEDGIGQVGIGKPTPSEALDVAGNIQATGTIKSGNSIIIDGVNDKIMSSSGTISFDNDNISTAGIIQSTSGGFKFPDGTVQTTATGEVGVVDPHTKLMLYMDDTGLTDSSVSTHTVTKNGDIARNAAHSKFGGYSAYFDGDGDYLNISGNSDDWDFGNSDWTIDFWLRVNEVSGLNYDFLIKCNGIQLVIYEGGTLYCWLHGTTEAEGPIGPGSITLTDTWYHIALVRIGNAVALYVNGVIAGALSYSGSLIESPYLTIGGQGGLVYGWLNGYIDEFRISKGIARWTSNFDPPSAPYSSSPIQETDPTVPANLKDGVSWSEVANIPADIADGDQVGITTEQDPKVGSTTANSIPKWDGATGTLVDSSSIVEDGSGNVGVGTTNPAYKLDINGTINATEIFKNGVPFSGSSLWTDAGAYIHANNATNVVVTDSGSIGIGTTNPQTFKLNIIGSPTYPAVQIDSPNYGASLFLTDSALPNGPVMQLGVNRNGDGYLAMNSFSGNPPLGLQFYTRTSSVSRMTIADSGNVGIGTTSPSYKLHVIGDIACTGNFVSASDLRLKENITPLTNAIDKVSALRGIYFNLKDDSSSKRRVGVIAQEVEAVLPEAVSEDAQGYKSVDYSKLTPLLIEATKEQQAQIELLKAQDETKQAQIEALKAQDVAKQAQIESQQSQIEALKALICQDHPEAQVCQ